MKVFRIILVILLLFSIIFLGGAFLLPDKQYFTETRIIKTDPVAVFSIIEDTTILESIAKEVFSNQQVHIEIQEKIEYSEISYLIIFDTMRDSLNAGFVLNEDNEGTELTAYLRIDSLQYPFERWKGYLIPFIHRKNFMDIIDKLEIYLLN